MLTLPRIRTKVLTAAHDKENIPAPKAGRLSVNSPAAIDRLVKPFKCPGSANARKSSGEPARKRRKVNYAEANGGNDEDNSGGFSINGESVALKDRYQSQLRPVHEE